MDPNLPQSPENLETPSATQAQNLVVTPPTSNSPATNIP